MRAKPNTFVSTGNEWQVAHMLTEREVRLAKPRDKNYNLEDANALYAYIATSSRKTWRWKYRFAGKERRLVFWLRQRFR